MKQIGLFDESNCMRKLSKLGDQLEKLDRVVEWHLFEGIVDSMFVKQNKGVGGRPPYSYMLLFKTLVLQRLFNISDDQAEYQINDRMTFREQKAENKRKSRVRSRVEHVFGYMTGTMRGITVRSIGMARAAFNNGLTNLVYNLFRYEILCRNLSVAG